MGSQLSIGDRNVWLCHSELLAGGFSDLAAEADGVEPVDLVGAGYGGLCDYLRQSHLVIPFAFDWRKSIVDAADRLASEVEKTLEQTIQPVRFIAHGMGGLVVRALIASRDSLWESVCQRDGARLVMLVWQQRDRNEWATAIDAALSADSLPQPITRPNAFSLAEPAVTQRTLAEAGFENVQLADVHEPVYYGAGVDDAYGAVLHLWNVETRLAGLDTARAGRTRSRLRATIEAHTTDVGIVFDSGAWIVSAVNR
jgi:pimeloyl-ACP methyl ester carboxylesterase